MEITPEMIEAAAVAIVDFRHGPEWKADWHGADVRKFGDLVDEDFIGMASAALLAAANLEKKER